MSTTQREFAGKCNTVSEVCQSDMEYVQVKGPAQKPKRITKISKSWVIIKRIRSISKLHVGFKSVLNVKKKLLSYTNVPPTIFSVSAPHNFIHLKMIQGVALSNADLKQHVLLDSPFPFARILFLKYSKNSLWLPRERREFSALKPS